MFNAYQLALYCHFLGVCMVVGGCFSELMLLRFVLKHRKPSEFAHMLQFGRMNGNLSFLGALVAITSGIGLTHVLHFPLNQLWIIASLVLWCIAVILGYTIVRPHYEGLGRRVGELFEKTPEAAGTPMEGVVTRGVIFADVAMLLINLATIGLMVMRPQF